MKIINLLAEIKKNEREKEFREEIHKRAFPGYMVIGRKAKEAGLFSDYLVFLGEIEFAVTRGYTPIIDLKNYPRFCIQDRDMYYKENSWEYFFEQPCGVGMDDIAGLKGHIVYAPVDFGSKVFHGMKLHRVWNDNPALFNYWKELAQKYIRFKKEILEECRTEFNNLFKDSTGKTVGVAIREGYYLAQVNLKWAGGGYDEHKVNVRQYIEEVRKIIAQDHEINGIFVSCEFEGTIRKFQESFPDKKIYFVDKERYTSPRKYPYDVKQRELYYDSKNKGSIAINYIKEIYILSTCDSYIYSECSGGVAVLLLKKGEFDRRVCL